VRIKKAGSISILLLFAVSLPHLAETRKVRGVVFHYPSHIPGHGLSAILLSE